jgi:phage terminase small subunit
VSELNPLTAKQKRFIDEFLIDFNATQAAIRSGYSKRSASVIGCENLTKPNVKAELERRISELSMTADEVLLRLGDMARGNLADLMDMTTAGFTFKLMSRDENGNLVVNPKTKLIKKIKQKVTTIIGKGSGDDKEIVDTELELYSAQEALNLLGKYHALFKDHVEHDGEIRMIVEYADGLQDNPTETP